MLNEGAKVMLFIGKTNKKQSFFMKDRLLHLKSKKKYAAA